VGEGWGEGIYKVRPNYFYALWPDDATRTKLGQLQSHIRGRLTRPNNLHLTLAFLGQPPDALLPILRSILIQLKVEPITLTIDRLGYFNRNRIAWAGMTSMPDALITLQKTLSRELTRKGIESDNQRAYKPHITLARDAEAPSVTNIDPFEWRADRVVLARSPLPEERPWYQVLAEKTPSPLAGEG